MKPTTSAIRQFFCVGVAASIATPVASSPAAATSATTDSTSKQKHRQLRRHPKQRQQQLKQHHKKNDELVAAKFENKTQSSANDGKLLLNSLSGGEIATAVIKSKNNNRLKSNQHAAANAVDGEQLSPFLAPKSWMETKDLGKKGGKRCYPDMGVLACPNRGESCKRFPFDDNDKHDAYNDDNNSWRSNSDDDDNWYCVADGYHIDDLENGKNQNENVIAENHRRRLLQQQDDVSNANILHDGQNVRHLRQFQHRILQSTGPVYDRCSTELEYKYESTVLYPSAHDRCVCIGYNNNLPYPDLYDDEYANLDIQYCHKINRYYCSNYYEGGITPDGSGDSVISFDYDKPTEYDACLCEAYKEGKVPDVSENFCTNMPERYCNRYYASDGEAAVAKCLCDVFYEESFCDIQLDKPNQTPEPTREPTPIPTMNPTSVPTPKRTNNPTGKPTPSPSSKRNPETNKPTNEPTNPPTDRPTRYPTKYPTTSPTKHEVTMRTRAPFSMMTTENTVFPAVSETSALSIKEEASDTTTTAITRPPNESGTANPNASSNSIALGEKVTSSTLVSSLRPVVSPTLRPSTGSLLRTPTLRPVSEPVTNSEQLDVSPIMQSNPGNTMQQIDPVAGNRPQIITATPGTTEVNTISDNKNNINQPRPANFAISTSIQSSYDSATQGVKDQLDELQKKTILRGSAATKYTYASANTQMARPPPRNTAEKNDENESHKEERRQLQWTQPVDGQTIVQPRSTPQTLPKGGVHGLISSKAKSPVSRPLSVVNSIGDGNMVMQVSPTTKPSEFTDSSQDRMTPYLGAEKLVPVNQYQQWQQEDNNESTAVGGSLSTAASSTTTEYNTNEKTVDQSKSLRIPTGTLPGINDDQVALIPVNQFDTPDAILIEGKSRDNGDSDSVNPSNSIDKEDVSNPFGGSIKRARQQRPARWEERFGTV